jgi:leucyl aminopeptidase
MRACLLPILPPSDPSAPPRRNGKHNHRPTESSNMPADLILGPAPRGAAIASGVTTDRSGKPIAVPGLSAAVMAKRGFGGKPGQVLVVPGSQTRIFVGLGEASSITTDRLRSAAAAVARAATHESSVLLDLLGVSKLDKRAVAQALVEGAIASTYTYSGKSQPGDVPRLASVVIDPAGSRAVKDGARVGLAIVEATCLVRDLVNLPPAQLTPREFADRSVAAAEAGGFGIEVWDEHRIAEERLGGLLGVAQGGLEPPRLVRFEYVPEGYSRGSGRSGGLKPGKSLPTLAVVGKGITFDSGGLSLKPADGMMTMKCDMAGAATTLGLFTTLATLQPQIRVIGYCCLTENLPGERATKPGDVHVARNGKSFEILNTDAEGRLVLADGLSLAVEEKPDAIIDLATLTGAIIIALGKEITGLFGNNEGFSSQVKEAAKRAGEPMWELPVWGAYRRHIDSDVADMKNIGLPGQAGSIAAALFLQEFVSGVPWVHLDIAGTAWADGPHDLGPRGGTAAGLRTLVELVRGFVRP